MPGELEWHAQGPSLKPVLGVYMWSSRVEGLGLGVWGILGFERFADYGRVLSPGKFRLFL